MCVEIIKSNEQLSYKPNLPFKDQFCDCQEVLIDCEPTCPKVVQFLGEVEKMCKLGQSLPIQIKLANHSNLNLFSKIKKLNEELSTSDIISKMVLFHKNMDTKLKELSDMCVKDKSGG